MYHYAGNNPIKFSDPTGLHINDWQNNGDGTWTVKSEGAKIWDVWGKDWKTLSGISDDEAAKNIHVGETYGIKYSTLYTSPQTVSQVEASKGFNLTNILNTANSFLDRVSLVTGGLNLLSDAGIIIKSSFIKNLDKGLGLFSIGINAYKFGNNPNLENFLNLDISIISFLNFYAGLCLNSMKYLDEHPEKVYYWSEAIKTAWWYKIFHPVSFNYSFYPGLWR